eukprot:11194116-Lingulodinium_polyedra.AAC.2
MNINDNQALRATVPAPPPQRGGQALDRSPGHERFAGPRRGPRPIGPPYKQGLRPAPRGRSRGPGRATVRRRLRYRRSK